ncbi:hypothetical protein N7523_005144 [Penicillium sp. IBT 18751x]|nr:hypothetical protein N7523_005144 [Penicillium sp. IBT 18751x]
MSGALGVPDMQQAQRVEQARAQQMMNMISRQRQISQTNPNGPFPQKMDRMSGMVRSSHDGIPITKPTDIGLIGSMPQWMVAYETACSQGTFFTAQSVVPPEHISPALLNHGLTIALSVGNAAVAWDLIRYGAPLDRETPLHILDAPADLQIQLFQILQQHGWTPNSPGYYGAVLLPKVVTNIELLRWFLENGANPNLGAQRFSGDRNCESDPASCAALEAAATHGSVEAVQMLLDAGAEIRNGTPLHYASGACTPGASTREVASKEFDVSRIPVMALLVAHGADVNQRGESMLVKHHPIMYAVMAKAVERVRWLLEHGADPEARGDWGSAAEYAGAVGSQEMKRVVECGIGVRRSIHGLAGETLAIRMRPGAG